MAVAYRTRRHRTAVRFSARLQKQSFAITGSPTYQAYRLNISWIAQPTMSSTAQNLVQLSEIELLGQLVPV